MGGVVSDIVSAKLRHAALVNEMEQVILRAQETYKSDLDSLAKQIDTLEASAYIWCQQNPAEFGDKKSIDFTCAVVGFRTCPVKVAPLFSKDSDKAIARRLDALEWGEPYLTEQDPKLNKEALLSDRSKLTPGQLREAGIKFEQDEIFFIEPKSQVVDGTSQAAA